VVHIFMQCEALEGKLIALKILGQLCGKYSENPLMRNIIFVKCFKKGKWESFLKGLLWVVRSFYLKKSALGLWFLKIVNLFIKCEGGKVQVMNFIVKFL